MLVVSFILLDYKVLSFLVDAKSKINKIDFQTLYDLLRNLIFWY